MLILAQFVFGLSAGMRTFTAPAAIAWASFLGVIVVEGTRVEFVGSIWAVTVLTLLALGELAVDKHPKAPSRLQPGALIARLVSGGSCGVCIGSAKGGWFGPMLVGIGGAGVGAGVFWLLRTKLAEIVGKGWPVALAEDALAVGGVVLACVVLL